MTTPTLTSTLSVAEYIAFEEAAEEKHEYEDGVLIEMTGGTHAHNAIMRNLFIMIGVALRGLDFTLCNSEYRVRPGNHRRYYYPDLSVVAGQPQFDAAWQTATLLNPCLIVEVLSASTAARDRGVKFTHYTEIATLREYLLVDSERVQVAQWQRDAAGVWQMQTYSERAQQVVLESVPATLRLADSYERVEVQP